MNIRYFQILIIYLICATANAQQVITLSLDSALDIAQAASVDAFRANYMVLERSYNYFDNKMLLRPNLNFSLTPAGFNRSLSEVYTIDTAGRKISRIGEENTLRNAISLRATQQDPLFGGTFYLQSSLSALSDINNNSRSYTAIPININYSNRISGYMPLKWRLKISEKEFEKAGKDFAVQLEEINTKTVSLYFEVLNASTDLQMSKLTCEKADTLLCMADQRTLLGTVTREELLNLQLSSINAKLELETAASRLTEANSALAIFLGFPSTVVLQCKVPTVIAPIALDPGNVLDYACKANPQIDKIALLQMEAERQMVEANGSNGLSVSIDAGMGLNKKSNTLQNIYANSLDRENLELTVAMPIIDWGKRARSIKLANKKLELSKLENEVMLEMFKQEVLQKADEYNRTTRKLAQSRKGREVANEISELAFQRFALGKAGFVELNEAIRRRDAAARNELSVLQSYFISYFTIRKLTLFDFDANIELLYHTKSILNNNSQY